MSPAKSFTPTPPVRIYDFDRDFRLLSISQATTGRYSGANTWQLASVVETRFGADGATVRTLPTFFFVVPACRRAICCSICSMTLLMA